jgi:hypothetical protein
MHTYPFARFQMMYGRGECSQGAFYTMVGLTFWAMGTLGGIMNGSSVARGLEVRVCRVLLGCSAGSRHPRFAI